MEKVIDYMRRTKNIGLKFVKLDQNSLRLMVFTDAAFVNAEGFSAQLVFVLALTDASVRANVLHYCWAKSSRIKRSIMAAELVDLVNGYDLAYIMQHKLDYCMQKCTQVETYTEFRTGFNTIAKKEGTIEERFQFFVHFLISCAFLIPNPCINVRLAIKASQARNNLSQSLKELI